MGCYYSISGDMEIRIDNDSSRTKIAELIQKITDYTSEGWIDIFDSKGKPVSIDAVDTFWFNISCEDYRSHGSTTDVDRLIESLGKYAVQPAKFFTSCDDEHSPLWVGPDEESIRLAEIQDTISSACTLITDSLVRLCHDSNEFDGYLRELINIISLIKFPTEAQQGGLCQPNH